MDKVTTSKALRKAKQRLEKSPAFFLRYDEYILYKDTVLMALAVVEEELEN